MSVFLHRRSATCGSKRLEQAPSCFLWFDWSPCSRAGAKAACQAGWSAWVLSWSSASRRFGVFRHCWACGTRAVLLMVQSAYPQRLKPALILRPFAARLKSCPPQGVFVGRVLFKPEASLPTPTGRGKCRLRNAPVPENQSSFAISLAPRGAAFRGRVWKSVV